MGILSLLHADGFSFKKVSTHRGGEYHGPCPWCGGNDRFRVQPERDRFVCRACEKSGDSIQYLRDFRNMRYFEALAFLKREPSISRGKPTPRPAWEPEEATTPGTAWQERAASFLDGAVSCLWSRQGDKIRRWLNANKGLSDATIKAAGLGFNPADIFESRQSWGLEQALNDQGNEKKQWLPAGIVIPLTIDGAVHKLKIRRDNPGNDSRYTIVSGKVDPFVKTVFHQN